MSLVSDRALNAVLLLVLCYLLLHWATFRMEDAVARNAFLSRVVYGERSGRKEVFEKMYRKRRNVLGESTLQPRYPPSLPSSLKQEERLLLYGYCTNEDTLSAVQREMYRKSRAEVMGNGYDGSTGRWAGAAFYENHFGGVEVDLLNNANDTFRTLFYYQIYKNGNLNIIDHLNRFSKLYKGIRECQKEIYCSRLTSLDARAMEKTISYKDITSFFKDSPKSVLAPRDRFAFTFVRDPMSRFISGYAEIENIIKENKINTDKLHLFAELGSGRRFEEFIISLLAENGAKDYLQVLEHSAAHASYIAPQIGTLLFATLRENEPVRLYRLEKFAEEFSRLVADSKMERLAEVYSPTIVDAHFENSTVHLLAQSAANNVLHPTSARSEVFYRAICRLYLPDYSCLGYALPTQCAAVEAELLAELKLVEAVKQRFGDGADATAGRLLKKLRRLALSAAARVLCIGARSPDCASRVKHPELYQLGKDEL